MIKKAKKKKSECAGKCSAVGNAYKAIDGPCRKGITATLLKDLIAAAAKNGGADASKQCEQGCICGGRFRVTVIGKSPLQTSEQEQCVWYVAGVYEGSCTTRDLDPSIFGLDIPPDLPDDIARIVKRHEHGGDQQGHPSGACDKQPCSALGNALVTVCASQAVGIDPDLMTALIDAAAAVAREDANAKCPQKCECIGEFHVSDSGVQEVVIDKKTQYTWWIGGYWNGKCDKRWL